MTVLRELLELQRHLSRADGVGGWRLHAPRRSGVGSCEDGSISVRTGGTRYRVNTRSPLIDA